MNTNAVRAKAELSEWALSLRGGLQFCESDENRAEVSELIGMVEGALRLVERAKSGQETLIEEGRL